MPRKPDIDRPTQLVLMLPESIRARVDLHLVSELEGRVPKGAYQRFFIERIRDFFAGESLDLGAFAGCDAGIFLVRGSPESIKTLRRLLENVQS